MWDLVFFWLVIFPIFEADIDVKDLCESCRQVRIWCHWYFLLSCDTHLCKSSYIAPFRFLKSFSDSRHCDFFNYLRKLFSQCCRCEFSQTISTFLETCEVCEQFIHLILLHWTPYTLHSWTYFWKFYEFFLEYCKLWTAGSIETTSSQIGSKTLTASMQLISDELT